MAVVNASAVGAIGDMRPCAEQRARLAMASTTTAINTSATAANSAVMPGACTLIKGSNEWPLD
jgi:hypothetical protein